jgi:hypothetical protein
MPWCGFDDSKVFPPSTIAPRDAKFNLLKFRPYAKI